MGMVPSPQLDEPQEGRAEGVKQARKQVRQLLSDLLYPSDTSVERRRQMRYPFPQPVYLTLFRPDDAAPQGEPIVAAAKDLSESGIGFFHARRCPPGKWSSRCKWPRGAGWRLSWK